MPPGRGASTFSSDALENPRLDKSSAHNAQQASKAAKFNVLTFAKRGPTTLGCHLNFTLNGERVFNSEAVKKGRRSSRAAVILFERGA